MKASRYLIMFGLCAAALALYTTVGAVGHEVTARSTTLVLPKGRYTAIVFTGTGVANATAATGVIKVGRDQFLVNIGPGSTFAVPFSDGWELESDAEIKLTHGAPPISTVGTAWAITADGPLVLREK